jgi:hypothetical protein
MNTELAPMWMYYAVHFGFNKVGDIIKSKTSDDKYIVKESEIINDGNGTSLQVRIDKYEPSTR